MKIQSLGGDMKKDILKEILGEVLKDGSGTRESIIKMLQHKIAKETGVNIPKDKIFNTHHLYTIDAKSDNEWVEGIRDHQYAKNDKEKIELLRRKVNQLINLINNI